MFGLLTRGGANNGGTCWAVGDIGSARGDGDLLSRVDGGSSHNGGSHEGSGGD
jgi:hypothetical protein